MYRYLQSIPLLSAWSSAGLVTPVIANKSMKEEQFKEKRHFSVGQSIILFHKQVSFFCICEYSSYGILREIKV